jgi:long-subunit acyl-CoA synthetase (AMP-forming)
MRLQISTVIDNSHVRLDFRKSPDRPDNVPSYKIENSKADEFVLKYNKLNDKLNKTNNIIIALGVISGAIGGLNIILKENAHKWLKASIALLGTSAFAIGATAIISSKIKNNLMDKYNVKEIK